MAEGNGFRTISRDYPDGTRLIAAVTDTDDPNEKSDEEVLDDLEELMEQRSLRAVDDPE